MKVEDVKKVKEIKFESADMYYNYLIDFLDKEWLEDQIEFVKEKLTEEKVNFYGHPLIKDYYDTIVKLRAGAVHKQKYVLLGTGYSNMVYLGKNLHTLETKGLDLQKFLPKLRSEDNFYDTCWEIETMATLLNNGADSSFIEETTYKTADIINTLYNVQFDVECKNKHVNDIDYVNNSSFCYDLSKKMLKMLEQFELKNTDIEFTIDGNANRSDFREITKEFRKMLKEKINHKRVKGMYRLKHLGIKFRNKQTGTVMPKNKYEGVLVDKNLNNRIFSTYPPQVRELKNLSDLLRKANKQFDKNLTSCLFLQVPFDFFEQAEKEINFDFKTRFSNISVVKLVSQKSYYPPKNGLTKVYREHLIINENAIQPFPKELEELFSESMFYRNHEKENIVFIEKT